MIGASANGVMLPIQLIFKGKTALVHPQTNPDPSRVQFANSDNHWASEGSTLEFLKSIVNFRKRLGRAYERKSALIIWDVYVKHRSKPVRQIVCIS